MTIDCFLTLPSKHGSFISIHPIHTYMHTCINMCVCVSCDLWHGVCAKNRYRFTWSVYNRMVFAFYVLKIKIKGIASYHACMITSWPQQITLGISGHFGAFCLVFRLPYIWFIMLGSARLLNLMEFIYFSMLILLFYTFFRPCLYPVQ